MYPRGRAPCRTRLEVRTWPASRAMLVRLLPLISPTQLRNFVLRSLQLNCNILRYRKNLSPHHYLVPCTQDKKNKLWLSDCCLVAIKLQERNCHAQTRLAYYCSRFPCAGSPCRYLRHDSDSAQFRTVYGGGSYASPKIRGGYE